MNRGRALLGWQTLDSVATGDFAEMVEDLQASGLGEADVFVCSFGGAGEAQYGVAAGDEAVGDGIEDFVVDGIAGVFGACFAKEREGEPFADERDVAGAVEGQSYGLQAAKVFLHESWVVVGAGAVGSGDEDHQRWDGGKRHFGHCVDPFWTGRDRSWQEAWFELPDLA
jgi:hypothetical protein